MNANYQIGFSLICLGLAQLVRLIQDRNNPDEGMQSLASVCLGLSVVLWILGIINTVRARGIHWAWSMLGFFWLPGYMILQTISDSWSTFGPDTKSIPSLEEREARQSKLTRLDW